MHTTLKSLLLKATKGVVLGPLLLLSACFNATVPLDRTATPDPDSAYVYGRFFNASHATLPMLGMTLTDLKYSGYPYLIGFKPAEEAIYAIKVAPGTYRLSNFVTKSQVDTWPITSPALAGTFEIKAGSAYYIGDFTAGGSDQVITHSLLSSNNQPNWADLGDLTFRFRKTTALLELAYPHLQSLPKVAPYNRSGALETLEADDTLAAGEGALVGELRVFSSLPKAADSSKVSLLLTSESGKNYSLPFSARTGLIAAALPSGTYKIRKIIIGEKSKAAGLESAYSSFTIHEGKTTYIGHHVFDFHNGGYLGATDKFDDSSEHFRTSYPQLANAALVNGR